MTDLEMQYSNHRAAINAGISTLKKQLSCHAKSQKAHGTDRDYVGDLVRVDRMLREILEAI